MSVVLLFAGDSYYPSGGWHDLIDTFATVEEAKAYVDGTRTERTYGVGELAGYYKWSGSLTSYQFDWAHIVVDDVLVLRWDPGVSGPSWQDPRPAQWVTA